MRAVIDSQPLSRSIFRCYDYSGLQLNLLTNCPLSHNLVNLAIGEEVGKAITIEIGRENLWSDGTHITALDYLEGIKHASHSNPFIKSYLLRHIESMEATGDKLTVNLSKINCRMPEILRIPNFCPYRNGQSSGEWILSEAGTDNYIFTPNPYRSNSEEPLHIHIIKDPMKNIDSFIKNQVDITSDTAFPYDLVSTYSQSPELHSHSVGLFCVLKFGQNLCSPERKPARQLISALCSATSFDSITFGHCPKFDLFIMDPNCESSSCIPEEPLILAYDNFYPNKEVCTIIADTLKNNGFKIELIEDDYYHPAIKYDLRLSIIRGLRNSPYLLYASLLFSEVLRQNRELQKKYMIHLIEFEMNPAPNTNGIKQFIQENAILAPLFEIRSTYLARNGINPLVKGVLQS